ncbi:MAG: hypothetical protein NTW87_33635 [Planctomycetota bacterium]|nr:hypothetical protein [Planctomycetota bacterium]
MMDNPKSNASNAEFVAANHRPEMTNDIPTHSAGLALHGSARILSPLPRWRSRNDLSDASKHNRYA